MAEREKDTEKWLRQQIEKLGGVFWKFTSPGTDGVPDRIAVFPDGRLVFVELKTGIGKLKQIQRYQIGRLLLLQQQVCVVHGRKAADRFLQDMQWHSVSSVEYYSDGEYDLLHEG